MSEKRLHKFENNKKYYFPAQFPYFDGRKRKRFDTLTLKDWWGVKRKFVMRSFKISGNGVEIEVVKLFGGDNE